MSVPPASTAGLQHEVDRQLLQQQQQLGTASNQTNSSHPQLPHQQHQHQPTRSSFPPPSQPLSSTSSSNSILPPLSEGRRASGPIFSPKPNLRTPISASSRLPSAGTASAGTPAVAQNGSVAHSPQMFANSGANSPAAPSNAPSAAPVPPKDTPAAPPRTSASMASGTMLETPVPVPPIRTLAGEAPKPKPTYKMKRTGKPGMPPGIPLNISVSTSSSPSHSPSMTPPPSHMAYPQSKVTQKPTASTSHTDNPQPAAITSDIAPMPSSMSRPRMNGNSMRPPPKAPGQSHIWRSDSGSQLLVRKDKQPATGTVTQPNGVPTGSTAALAAQPRAGDKRRKSLSPDALQAHDKGSPKRARLAANAEFLPIEDIDSDDDSDGNESEDAADGEGSDEDEEEDEEEEGDEEDEDEEEEGDGDDSEDDDSESSSSAESIPMAATRPGLPTATPITASVSAPVRRSSTNPEARNDKTAPKKARLGRPPGSKTKAKSQGGSGGGFVIPIFFTPSGRSYNIWINDRGIKESTSGAIIPDGYKLHTDTKFPWICPVRSCRKMFSHLSGLGHHFSRGHRSSHLNDNLDGTLTVVKQWETNMSIGARVVSQKRLADPGPIVPPRLKRGEKHTHETALPGATLNTKESRYISLESVASNDGYWSSTSADSMPPLVEPTPMAKPPPQAKTSELLTSASGRAYTKYLDGTLAHGVAFPDGYKPSSYPGHPWVCPVRNCRRVLKAVHNLGGHYTRQHRDCLLNENIDGTHSVVGHYNGRRPLVVSHHRVPITELEPLAEEIPAGVVRPPMAGAAADMVKQQDRDESLVEEHSATMDGDDTLMGNTDLGNDGVQIPGRHPDQPQHSDLATPIPGNSEAMWQYIEPALRRTSSRATLQKSYMHLFLELPRKREIHWNTPWIAQNPYLDSQPRDIASLVVHLTGDYAEEPCSHCKLGKGPYSGCIVVSREAAPGLLSAFDSCANCLYHCGHAYCTMKTTLRKRFKKLCPDLDFDATRRYVRSGVFSRDIARGGMAEAAKSLMAFAGKGGVDAAAADERAAREAAKQRHRKYERAQRHMSSDIELSASAAERKKRKQAQELRAELQRRSTRIAGIEAPQVPRSTTAIPVPVPGLGIGNGKTAAAATSSSNNGLARQNPALIFAGAAQPGPEVLEMEDWEVAPGRVESDATTVAYSNAYLTSAHMVPIDHNKSCRVQVVQPGAVVSFPSEATSMRICSVARGKLRVTVGDARFVIGPNGLFKVLPGVAFSVENRLYIDACMQIMSLQD